MSRISKRPPDELATIVPDSWTEPFWAAARDKHLTCAQCGNCHKFRMPPSPFCPHCRSQEVEWPTLAGTGTIYSFTIVERAVIAGTEDTIPYVVAVVSLDGAEPARLITNVVDSPIDAIRIGARVEAVFDEMSDGTVVPRFRLQDLAQ